jgi:hypothetical protein
MPILSVWVIEFTKLLGGRRLHPLNAECPICHQMVRLHYNKAGRRHLLAHARDRTRLSTSNCRSFPEPELVIGIPSHLGMLSFLLS